MRLSYVAFALACAVAVAGNAAADPEVVDIVTGAAASSAEAANDFAASAGLDAPDVTGELTGGADGTAADATELAYGAVALWSDVLNATLEAVSDTLAAPPGL
jgi:hypothetical protein